MSEKGSTLTWVQQHWPVLQFGFYQLHFCFGEPTLLDASFLNKYQRNNQAIPHPQTPEEQQQWLAYHLLYAESLNEDFETGRDFTEKRNALRKKVLDHAINLAIDIQLAEIQQKNFCYRNLGLSESLSAVTLPTEALKQKMEGYTQQAIQVRTAANRINSAWVGVIVAFFGAVIAIALIALSISIAPLALFIIPALLIAAGIALSVLLARSFKKLNEAEKAMASIKKELKNEEMISSIRTSINTNTNKEAPPNATSQLTRTTSLTTLSSLSTSEESDKKPLAQAKKAASLAWVQQHWMLLEYGFRGQSLPFGQDYPSQNQADDSIEKQQKWLAYHYLYARSLNQQFEIDINFEENEKKLREYVSTVAARKYNIEKLNLSHSEKPTTLSPTLDNEIARFGKHHQKARRHFAGILPAAVCAPVAIILATIATAIILTSFTTGLVLLLGPALFFAIGIALVGVAIYSGYKHNLASKKVDNIVEDLTGKNPNSLLSKIKNEILSAHKGSPTPAATTSTPAAVDGGAAATSTTTFGPLFTTAPDAADDAQPLHATATAT